MFATQSRIVSCATRRRPPADAADTRRTPLAGSRQPRPGASQASPSYQAAVAEHEKPRRRPAPRAARERRRIAVEVAVAPEPPRQLAEVDAAVLAAVRSRYCFHNANGPLLHA